MELQLLIKETSTLYRLIRPFFGFSGNNLKRLLGLVAMVICNTIAAFSLVYINDAFSVLNSIVMQAGVTSSAIFSGVFWCLLPICLYGTLYAVGNFITSSMANNLHYKLGKDYLGKWKQNNTFYGIRFVQDKKTNPSDGINNQQDLKEKHVSGVLGKDLEQISTISMSLINSFTAALLNFFVAIYQFWYLSAPLVLNIFSMSIAIPGYMVLFAVVYSIGYSYVVTMLDENLQIHEKNLRAEQEQFSRHLHHNEEHAEAIALKKGAVIELRNLKDKLKSIYVSTCLKVRSEFGISFFQVIGSSISYMLGLVLSVPGIVAGTIKPDNIFSISAYFTNIVSFFTWRKNNTQTVVNIDVSLERFSVFDSLIQDWDKIRKEMNDRFAIDKAQDGISINATNLSIYTPDGSTISKNVSFDLPVGKVTLIQGDSGIGKTTLFRTLSNLWPFVAGRITFPLSDGKEAKVYYIPQQPHFPYGGSLMDAIMYPSEAEPTDEVKARVKAIMTELRFSEAKIQNLETKDYWKNLSGGEKQRIPIIAAIIANPNILFMDEGMSGLDFENEKAAKEFIKKYLGDATIAAIDHHAEPKKVIPFYDYKLAMSKQDLNSQEVSMELQKFCYK